jgi:hypothetical protein
MSQPAPSETGAACAFRVLIADDHAVVRGLLGVLLENHQDLQVCGEAENCFETIVDGSLWVVAVQVRSSSGLLLREL